MKKIIFICFSSLLIITILFFVLELILTFIFPRIRYQVVAFSSDKEIGYKLKENQNTKFIRDEFSTTFQTNSEGFRDSEFKQNKDIKYIFFLGDSLTMGYGVEVGERFSDIFEKKLKENIKGYECLNFGIMGYANVNEYAVLKKYVNKFKPKYVFLQFHEGDLFENYYYPFLNVEGSVLVESRESEEGSVFSFARRMLYKSNLIKYIFYKYKGIFLYYFASEKIRKEAMFFSKTRIVENQYIKDLFKNTFSVLEKISTFSKQNDIKLILFTIPSHRSFNTIKGKVEYGQKENYIEEKIEIFSKAESVKFISLHGILKEKSEENNVIFPIDKHLNSFGHKVVGSYLFQEFKALSGKSMKPVIPVLK